MKPNPLNDQAAMYMLSVGAIEVDDEGRIWKLKERRKGIGRHIWKDIEPRRLEYKQRKGYLRVSLYINKKRYHVLAHRIVWLTLNGLIPKHLQVNHKNGIKDDNRSENLELVTMSENMRHRIDVLGVKYPNGEKHWKAKLKEQNIRDIRELYRTSEITQTALGVMYGVTKTNISHIINKRRWAHI